MPVTRSGSCLAPNDGESSKQVLSDAVSCSGSHSSLKSASSSARSRVLIAELRAKQLQERLELEVQQQLLQARQEVERAKLEETIGTEPTKVVNFEDATVDNSARIQRYVDDCKAHAGPKLVVDAECATPSGMTASTLQRLINGSELPRVELTYFDGNPLEYWKFVRQFEYYVEGKTTEDGQRLLYLLHYCKGRAKDAIGECIMLPPAFGYPRARKILRDLFGQTHHVARTLLDRLLSNEQLVSNREDHLSDLAVRMENCHIALTQMNYTADMNSLGTLEAIVRTLPKSLQHRWAEFVDKLALGNREQEFLDLLDFVTSRARINRSRFGQLAASSERRLPNADRFSHPKISERKSVPQRSIFASQSNSKIPLDKICLLCKNDHSLESCEEFASLDVRTRWNIMKAKNLCFNCLNPGHQAQHCHIRKVCSVGACKAKHHSLLHSESAGMPKSTASVQCGATYSDPSKVVLGMVPVKVVGPTSELQTYAFLDSGSNTTLVSQEVVDCLQLVGEPSSLSITTVAGSQTLASKSVELMVHSLNGEDGVAIEHAFVVPNLQLKPPSEALKGYVEKWPHLSGIRLDDIPEKKVGLLIGTDVPEAHWILDQRLGKRKQPYAVKTLLGWMLLGPLTSGHQKTAIVNCLQKGDIVIAEQNMYNAELEYTDKLQPSSSQAQAVELVQKTTKSVDEHYIVPLPWRDTSIAMPNNRMAADMEEMLMQVRVPQQDQGALRFLWWPEDDMSREPVEYQMVAHPFGAVSSPFCANFALRKTVEDSRKGCDANVVGAVVNHFHVDDCLASLKEVDEAEHFVTQICELLENESFRLRKWTSNCPKVLSSFLMSERGQKSKEIGTDLYSNARMLGLEWNASSDMFSLRFEHRDGPVTHRVILSSISSLYDPFGIVAHRPLVSPTSNCRDEASLSLEDLRLVKGDQLELPPVNMYGRYTKRWKQGKYLATVFWHRLLKEYEPTLKTRPKRLHCSRNIRTGELVLVAAEGESRDNWPLGILLHCEISEDGIVCTVSINNERYQSQRCAKGVPAGWRGMETLQSHRSVWSGSHGKRLSLDTHFDS